MIEDNTIQKYCTDAIFKNQQIKSSIQKALSWNIIIAQRNIEIAQVFGGKKESV